jgi:Domain of unknown function (DUF4922)
VNSLNNSLLAQKTFAVFNSTSTYGTLVHLCHNLIEQQKLLWLQLTEGYTALESVRVREIICSNYSVSVQFNPKRIRSTGADLDAKTIRERKCFLCLENLPELQKGILYRDKFLLLCNPVPIFTQHFTFSSTYHIPQELESSLCVLLNLTRDLSPDFTVFYNGPKSGASAPDHLHFQVCPRRAIPIECDAVDMHRRKRLYYKDHVAGYVLLNYGRTALIVESTDKLQLLEFLENILEAWKKILGSLEEPKMNILCSYQEELWRLIILPRRKHRPDIYFLKGDDRVLISPAAVDIGGLVITPLEKDYLRTDAELIENIFAEVTESPEIIEKILENMS